MTCLASDRNDGLDMETWSGDIQSQTPKPICNIDSVTTAKHCVRITNWRGNKRTIHVKGTVSNLNNKAKFEGPTVQTERTWIDSDDVYPIPANNSLLFASARIVQKSNGHATIEVEIEYEDDWEPRCRIRADRAAKPLQFSVNLI
jgi:hypothetical protein